MNQDVAKRNDLQPRDVRMAFPELHGEAGGCFTDCDQLLNDSASEKFGTLKFVLIDSVEESR